MAAMQPLGLAHSDRDQGRAGAGRRAADDAGAADKPATADDGGAAAPGNARADAGEAEAAQAGIDDAHVVTHVALMYGGGGAAFLAVNALAKLVFPWYRRYVRRKRGERALQQELERAEFQRCLQKRRARRAMRRAERERKKHKEGALTAENIAVSHKPLAYAVTTPGSAEWLTDELDAAKPEPDLAPLPVRRLPPTIPRSASAKELARDDDGSDLPPLPCFERRSLDRVRPKLSSLQVPANGHASAI